jgi:dTDP-glucose pyrophosphorylase
MKAVILAAGKGTRLAPLTDVVPKPLLKVNNVPMLERLLLQLKEVGIMEVVVIVHHLKGQIMNYCEGSVFGMTVTCVEQTEMKGTGNAVLYAEPHVKDTFLCIAVDSLFKTELLTQLTNTTSEGAITCREVENPERYGILQVDGNKVTKIVEKSDHPPSNLANFSVYKFPVQIFEACKKLTPSPRGELEITDAIQDLIEESIGFECVKTDKILDVGTKAQLDAAQSFDQ